MNTRPPQIKLKDPEVAKIFQSYPKDIKGPLLKIRALIYEVSSKTPEIGPIEETLRWNQPSYITSKTKAGSLIRIAQIRSQKGKFALYFHCQTTLVRTFRARYPKELKYEGNRAIIFDLEDKIPWNILKDCIYTALTYNIQTTH